LTLIYVYLTHFIENCNSKTSTFMPMLKWASRCNWCDWCSSWCSKCCRIL